MIALRRRLLLLGLVLGWALMMHHFGGNIYGTMGPFALAVSLLVGALWSHSLSSWFRPTKTALLSGVGVGLTMTLLTYPIFTALAGVFPELGPNVASLYLAERESSRVQALLWMLPIICAEEVLWRGALPNALSASSPSALALSVSLSSYALAQLGTGSWLVALLALVCGAIWTLQRRLTDSLLAPLIAHLIWTPTVILFRPVL